MDNKEKKKKKRQKSSFRQDLSATLCALLVVAAIFGALSLFRAGELPGKLLCETQTAAGTQSFVYDFSSRKKTQLYVEGYSDVRGVTGYHGDDFFCCAKQGDADYVVQVRNGKALRAYPAEQPPRAMVASGDFLYLLLGGADNGALVQMDPATGAQTVLAQNLFSPGGFCAADGQFLIARRQGADVLWKLLDSRGETPLLQADAGVSALALFGGYAYFCDASAGRVFRVSVSDGKRSEIAVVPLLAKAKNADAIPVFAFSNTKERAVLLLTNGKTPLGFQAFVGKGRLLQPMAPFGLISADARFTSITWI